MFEKERELLTMGWKFDFSKFESAIEQRKKFESTLDNVQAKVAEAQEKAKDCRSRINAPDGVVAVRNETTVKALYVAISDWQSLYTLLRNMSKASPKAFEEKSVAAGMKELSTYVEQFEKYIRTETEFVGVVELVKELKDCGKLSERTVADFCKVIHFHGALCSSAYLPSDIAKLIDDALAMESTIDTLNGLYERLEKHLELSERGTRINSPSAIKSIAAEFRRYDEYVGNANEEIEALQDCQKEFKQIEGDRSLEIFSVYEKEYAARIESALKVLRERLSALRAAHAAIEGHISIRGVIAKVLGIMMYVMMGGAAICTVLNTIIVFARSINWFWAILFGLIVGVLFAVVRIAAMYGLGALWWPTAFATMFFGPRSAEVNKLVLIFNIVFLVVSFLYAELTIYREDRDLRNGSSSGIRSVALGVPFIGACALVIAVIWSGIAGLVKLWSIWGIFEVFCGFFLGLFRVIMLIIGAGFWWPSLFSVTGDNGTILNAAFYILIVIFGVYAARQKD